MCVFSIKFIASEQRKLGEAPLL